MRSLLGGFRFRSCSIRIALALFLAVVVPSLAHPPETHAGRVIFASDYLSFELPSSGRDVATGDLDGDANLDLVVVTPPTVSVLLGRGDGTFEAAVGYAAGSGLTSVVLGDWNEDGRLDAAVTSAASVTTLLGDGAGGFGSSTQTPTGVDPREIIQIDVNGDQHLDLVVPNWSGTTLSILLGAGNGTFTPADPLVTGTVGPKYVAAADFNLDGTPDLAVAHSLGSTVRTYLGTGTSFSAGQVISTSGSLASVGAGDVNGDSKPDLAFSTSSGVATYLGVGDGTFQPGGSAGPLGNLTLRDLDGDGFDDVVGTNQDHWVVAHVSRGDGGFEQSGQYPTGDTPFAVTIGDWDGDGKLDAATANNAATVSMLPGNGDGTFGRSKAFATGVLGYAPSDVAVGAFDGNPIVDLATVTWFAQTLSVLLGQGSGDFGAASQLTVNWPTTVVSAELNGDASSDLVCSYGPSNFGIDPRTGAAILMGNGDGTFGSPLVIPTGTGGPGVGGSSVSTADLDTDGATDVVTTNPTQNTVSILMGRGDGTFEPKVDYGAGQTPAEVAIGDVDGDGDLDLAVANRTAGNSISILRGPGDGTFSPVTSLASISYPSSIAAGDVDGDGDLDLVVVAGNVVSIHRGLGDGTFLSRSDFPVGTNAFMVRIADVSDDGHPDLLVASANALSLLLGRGDGTFGDRLDYGRPGRFALGDLNDDSRVDLAVADFRSSQVAVMLNSGGGIVDTTPPALTVVASPAVLWPPNHRLEDIHLTVTATDDQDPNPTITLVSATSSEPDVSADPEDLPNDIQGAELGTLDVDLALHAERLSNDGRTYTVCYEARDFSGNAAQACQTVRVPHDRSGRAGLELAAGSWKLIAFGGPSFAARTIAVSTVEVMSNQEPKLKGGSGEPQYGDFDGDGREDARVPLSGSLFASEIAGASLMARWEDASQGYLASITGSVTGASEPGLSFCADVSPNPTRGEALIRYAIPSSGRVKLSVFDVAGHWVAQPVDRWLIAGEHVQPLRLPAHAASQVYWYRLEWGGREHIGKLVWLR
jgi:VCBS repeat protein